ncbi:MAG TPA: thioredoxin-disulfide reductase [Clostridia bacterium]|nr:thioredoxin-disulfide reductase [Clostridia bacterium]
MYDIIIIGAGPAGLTAGIYATRSGFKALILEKLMPGGQAATTGYIGNYPGFVEGISGVDLAFAMEAQAARAGAEIRYETATRLILYTDPKKVITENGEYTARIIILAMGGKPKKLGLEGEKRLAGKGVSYCATCDGAVYKDKVVAVVGGGNAAAEYALDLARYTQKVYLIHRRDTMRADKVYQDEIMRNDKIVKVFDSVVTEIRGEKIVEYIETMNTKTRGASTIKTDAVFIAIGHEADSALAKGLVDMDENGFIITDEAMRTSVKGVFAAGDIRSKAFKQVVTAAADGAIAAYYAGFLI